MKKILIVSLMSFVTFAEAQQNFSMSLQEAISYAIDNQPQYQNLKLDRQISGSKNMEATVRYLPKVNGTVDFRDNLKLGEIALRFPNPLTGQDEDRRIQQGTKYSGTAGVDLTQPIVDMGTISDIGITKAQINLTEIQLQQALIDLKVNITKAYYLSLLNNERVAKAKKTVERNQKAYNDTKVRYDNQNALKTDLNRAYLNLSNSKYQLKVAEDSVKTSSMAVAQLIGLPVDATLELKDKLPDVVPALELPEYPDLKSAEQNRTELRAEMQQMQLGKLQLRKINYQYIPSLNGYAYIGGQGLDNSTLFKNDKWFWTSYIGLRMNVPIFDGLQKMTQARQQKFQLQKNENNLRNIRSNINYQLQIAAVNYSNATKNLELVKENVALAESIVKDANTRYANGVALFQEVLDAENTLKETEFIYMQAMYTFLISELEWKKANGKL